MAPRIEDSRPAKPMVQHPFRQAWALAFSPPNNSLDFARARDRFAIRVVNLGTQLLPIFSVALCVALLLFVGLLGIVCAAVATDVLEWSGLLATNHAPHVTTSHTISSVTLLVTLTSGGGAALWRWKRRRHIRLSQAAETATDTPRSA
jgi:hypothetical protein